MMTNEPLCPAPALRGTHGLNQHKEAAGADFGAAEEPPTLDQVVARAQALSRKMVAGKEGASVEEMMNLHLAEISTQVAAWRLCGTAL